MMLNEFPCLTETLIFCLTILVNKLNKTKVMRVYTEDLNESISDVLCFLERGLTWL